METQVEFKRLARPEIVVSATPSENTVRFYPVSRLPTHGPGAAGALRARARGRTSEQGTLISTTYTDGPPWACSAEINQAKAGARDGPVGQPLITHSRCR